MNFFQHFGLEESFNVNQELLRKQYLLKSREVHPDLNSDKSNDDLIQLSALNNEAFSALKDEIQIIRHLLKVNGFDIESNQKPSPLFLAEMMELNEKIDEAKESGSQEELLECENEITNFETKAWEEWNEVKNLYNIDLDADAKISIFQKANHLLMVMKYVNRMKSLLKNENEL